MNQSLTNLNILYCNEGSSNKVWGWFQHGNHYWAFWGGVGKAFGFKHHGIWHLELSKLARAKQQKGYNYITSQEFDLLDPQWQERFWERFTFALLSSGTV